MTDRNIKNALKLIVSIWVIAACLYVVMAIIDLASVTKALGEAQAYSLKTYHVASSAPWSRYIRTVKGDVLNYANLLVQVSLLCAILLAALQNLLRNKFSFRPTLVKSLVYTGLVSLGAAIIASCAGDGCVSATTTFLATFTEGALLSLLVYGGLAAWQENYPGARGQHG